MSRTKCCVETLLARLGPSDLNAEGAEVLAEAAEKRFVLAFLCAFLCLPLRLRIGLVIKLSTQPRSRNRANCFVNSLVARNWVFSSP